VNGPPLLKQRQRWAIDTIPAAGVRAESVRSGWLAAFAGLPKAGLGGAWARPIPAHARKPAPAPATPNRLPFQLRATYVAASGVVATTHLNPPWVVREHEGGCWLPRYRLARGRRSTTATMIAAKITAMTNPASSE
jgi:hypothetical protein